MQIIENSKIKEKLYIEKLNNDLTVIIMPKKTRKKYIAWSTNYGSIDNKFYSRDGKYHEVPDGIAHYLEHKLFEQENGRNSLDVLTSLGVDANAYTTNDHTAYLYECTDNFFEALDEFMNYVQNPYFTDENVEKERGIIEQEIMMYDDYPEWSVYMNAMKAMYKNNEINIDVAGTKESIAKITPDKLYEIYDSFYYPSNMVLVLVGDINPKEILEDIKNNDLTSNKIKKDIAVDILSVLLLGKSSEFFENLYESGKILAEPSANYEFSKRYAHVLIQVQTNYIEEFLKEMDTQIKNIKENGIKLEDFERAKKRVYGDFIKEYNDVSDIATNLISDYFKDINTFEYLEEFTSMNKEYVEKVLEEVFVENRKVVSVIKPFTKKD